MKDTYSMQYVKLRLFSSVGAEEPKPIGGVLIDTQSSGPALVLSSHPLLRDTTDRYFLKANGPEFQLQEIFVLDTIDEGVWEQGFPPYRYHIRLG